MRLSRLKTLSDLVAAALRRCGAGVLALGRAMVSGTSAKHCIKRVWRFLRNDAVERHAVLESVFRHIIPRRGPVVILVDWTDLPPYRSLVLAVARDGRALPFFSMTIRAAGRGRMAPAEKEALAFVSRCIPAGRRVVLVADRGFGNCRWIREVKALGWSYVARLKKCISICNGETYCKLSQLGLRRGSTARCWGEMTVSDHIPTLSRIVTLWGSDAREPWYLATNLKSTPESITELYSRRMWIELMFRDLKNRRWGMGLGGVRLSAATRHDRLFLVVFLAYFFLCAFGAAAEARRLDVQLKANTVSYRVLSIATIGFLLMQKLRCSITTAVRYLRPDTCKIKTGDC